MNKFYALLFIAFISFTSKLHATHVAGADFKYECIGQDSFLITMNLYRDCSGVSVPPSAAIKMTNSCGVTLTTVLPLQNGVNGTDVSQLCADSLSNSTCYGGVHPGMQLYTYSGIAVLSSTCSNWTISWQSCCRNTTVNLVGQPASFMHATLINDGFSCNSSPVFSDNYIRYVCVNQNVSHSFSVYEPDGDSISYQFVAPMIDTANFVPFLPGFTYDEPIPGISLDSITGLIQFQPTLVGNYSLAVAVCEYDTLTGALKGCVIRDIEYVVTNCSGAVPQPTNLYNLTGPGYVADTNEVTVCEGDSFSFQVDFSDADVMDSIFISSNIDSILPGATLVTTFGNPVTVTISGVASSNLKPNNILSIYAKDNGCPVFNAAFSVIQLNMINSAHAGNNRTICNGSQWTPLKATGGTAFTWSVISGSPIDTVTTSPTFNMTCKNCANPMVSPQITTSYQLVSNVGSNCHNTDTVTVVVAPDFNLTMPNDTTICYADDYSLTVNLDQPFNYSYQWMPGNLLSVDSVASPITNPLSATQYFVSVTSAGGCRKTGSFNVDVGDPFPANNKIIGDTILCSGETTLLEFEIGNIAYENCGPTDLPCIGVSDQGQIGAQVQTNSINQYPSIYGGKHISTKHQILYTKNELVQMGMDSSGFINSISFFIDSLSPTVPTCKEYTIKMGCTSLTELTDFEENTSLYAVYYDSSYTSNQGWNTHVFDTSFLWSGNTNLLVEICFNNVVSVGQNAQIRYSSTSYTSVVYSHNSLGTNLCGTYNHFSTSSYFRPNTQFNYCTGVDTSGVNMNWYSSALSGNPNTYSISVSPTSSANYQVVLSDTFGFCKDTLNHYLNVVTQFDAGFTTGSPFCNSDSIKVFIPNIAGGVFSGAGVDSVGNFNPSVSGSGLWPITYSISSPAACANDSIQWVEVLPKPDASIKYREVCIGGDTIHLQTNTPGGTFFGPGILHPDSAIFDPVGLPAGNINIVYTIVDTCIHSDTSIIKINEPYTFQFNNNILNVCQEDYLVLSANYVLSNHPLQGSGPVIANWSDANGYVNPSTGVFDSHGVSPGDYIVNLEVTGTDGTCGTMQSMTVRVLKVDYPEYGDLIFCESDATGIITVTPYLYGTGTTFYTTPIAPLSPSNTLSITPSGIYGMIAPINEPNGEWEINVSYINLNSCKGISKDTIRVLPMPSDSIIKISNTQFKAAAKGYNYQWLDCDNNMVPVPGATHRTFSPPTTGNYAVEIWAGNCRIISNCVYGWSVGMEALTNDLGIDVFPNPVIHSLTVDLKDQNQVHIEILDAKGTVVLHLDNMQGRQNIDMSTFPSGMYILKARNKKGTTVQRVVKK